MHWWPQSHPSGGSLSTDPPDGVGGISQLSFEPLLPSQGPLNPYVILPPGQVYTRCISGGRVARTTCHGAPGCCLHFVRP